MPNKPTRIIKPPRRIPKKDPRSGGSPNKLEYLCDDMVWRTLAELSALIDGLTVHALQQRIKDKGWWHEDNLLPNTKRGKRLDGTATRYDGQISEGEWGGLSAKPRTKNLFKIKRPGIWEAMQK